MPPEVVLSLSSLKRHADDSSLRVANISWQETTNVQYHNKTYIIMVQPATQECNSSCVTANKSIELVLAADMEYNVTVIAEVCNGKLKSAKSTPLKIPRNGMIFQKHIHFIDSTCTLVVHI